MTQKFCHCLPQANNCIAIVTELQDLVLFRLIPRPEEEEEKGPGFSHLYMSLLISELSTYPSVGGGVIPL